MTVTLRALEPDDARVVAELYRANREFLAPWEPVRAEEFFTEEHQRELLTTAAERRATGEALPLMIMNDGSPAGRITVSDIVRGAFQSAHLGYWVAHQLNGRGVASAAVGRALEIAFGDLRLHRLQAGTLVHNVGSQKVLIRNGFQRIGLAPAYLKIAGTWQDHILFQRINPRPATVDGSF
jgi:ribosomal-protein-alanine N-acetyltransferase